MMVAHEENRSIAKKYAAELEELFKKDPDAAVRSVNKLRILAGNEIAEGSEYRIIPITIYNTVGKFYPYLSRENKDLCLTQILDFLDKTDSGMPGWRDEKYGLSYVQRMYTWYIKEPLLLADIALACRDYWPGLHQGEEVIDMYKLEPSNIELLLTKTGTFRQDLIDSDFIVGFSLLRSDCWKHGDVYASKANPKFLDRMVKATCYMILAPARTDEIFAKDVKWLKEHLPKKIHKRIDKYKSEKDWTRIEFREPKHYVVISPHLVSSGDNVLSTEVDYSTL